MYPLFFKIVHYLRRLNRIFVDMSYFLKIAVLLPILSTKHLSTTALLFKGSFVESVDQRITHHNFLSSQRSRELPGIGYRKRNSLRKKLTRSTCKRVTYFQSGFAVWANKY